MKITSILKKILDKIVAKIKRIYRKNFTIYALFIKPMQKIRYKLKPVRDKFIEIYYKNGFRGRVSISGPGSEHDQTQVIKEEIPKLVKEMNIRTVLDAACGDFHWMKDVELDVDKYIGADVVPEMIARNQKEYASEIREFRVLNITKDKLPQVDLIICRDCLVHLSHRDIIIALRNLKRSKSTYLLTTTYPLMTHNRNIVTGDWRRVNFQLPPFNFPRAIKFINEGCTENYGLYADKTLELWKLEDIRA